ncbi:MAG: LPS export ABC transporter ATP-binding protein [Terriglobia bacterium]
MQILSTVDLTKSYKGRKVVDGVSLRIAQGEVIGLLGPNGAGKTTTFYIIVGLVGADAGQVLLDGVDISAFPMYMRARNGISYLPQEPSIFRKLTVEENLVAILETTSLTTNQRRERLEELLEEFGLQKVRRSFGYLLSGGERRRVEVARSLAISPLFVLLDEPFAGIDPLAVLDIQRIILQLKSSGIGVLLTDHNVRETLQVTDRAYIISSGRIFRSGTPEELGNDNEVKKVYLGDNFRLAI